MSVYKHDIAADFGTALNSIVDNNLWPNEIVLVCDGSLNAELEHTIERYVKVLPLNVYRLTKNVGLGQALAYGLNQCQYDWIARFDADDICATDRFEKQIHWLMNDSSIDVLGGQIIEFNKSISEVSTVYKKVPLEHSAIYNYAQSRNPMNHMTVMFRKSAVLHVGGYQHSPLFEDYDLWVRMLLAGYTFANLEDVLVYARAGDSLYERRGGFSYAKKEASVQYRFYKLGFLSTYHLIKNLAVRLPIRLLPNSFRRTLYSNFLRQRK